MPDREKVIKGIEFHKNAYCVNKTGELCPYWSQEDCENDLASDALLLLKEQEAEWVYGEDETGVDGWRCSECNFFEPWFYEFDDDIDFIKRYEHCPKCGKRMTSYTGKQEGRQSE